MFKYFDVLLLSKIIDENLILILIFDLEIFIRNEVSKIIKKSQLFCIR